MARKIVAMGVLAVLVAAGGAASARVGEVSAERAAENIAGCKGKVAVVLLFSSACPYCRAFFPGYVKLAEKYGTDAEFLAFSTDGDARALEKYLDNHTTPFEVKRLLPFKPGQLVKAMAKVGIRLERRFGVPFTAVLAKDGRVAGQWTGDAARALEAAIQIEQSK